jgi:transcription antitermination factor NusG
MTDDEKIEQLTRRLRELNLTQEGIIRELETLTNKKKPKTPDAAGAKLQVGDKVQIVNRGQFRETSATITKIGKLVSLRLDTGQTTTRKSTNLLKQDVDRGSDAS